MIILTDNLKKCTLNNINIRDPTLMTNLTETGLRVYQAFFFVSRCFAAVGEKQTLLENVIEQKDYKLRL